MQSGLLAIGVTRQGRQSALVRVDGDLDFETSEELVVLASDLIDRGFCHLEFDLSGVRLCDSSGLSALIEVFHAAHRGGGSMRTVGVPTPLQRLLERTGLDSLLIGGSRPASDPGSRPSDAATG